MNEMTIKNRALVNATNKVIKLTTNMRNNAFEIAHIIADVDANKTYESDGFSSVHEWTEYAFGYKKSTSYSLLKIGREYTRVLADGKHYDCNLLPEDASSTFTTSQVEAMLPLDRPEVDGLVADGYIAPEMSVREIKKVVKDLKNLDKPEPEPAAVSEQSENEDSAADPDSMIDDELVEVTDEHSNIYRVPVYILLPYMVKQ